MNNLVFKIITGSKTAMIISVASLLLLSTHVHAVAVSDNTDIQTAKELVVTQGMQSAYNNLLFHIDNPYAFFYYSMIMACKYHYPSAYSSTANYLHWHIYVNNNKLTRKLHLLFDLQGALLKDPGCAHHLYIYYTRVEVDSLRASQEFYLYQLYGEQFYYRIGYNSLDSIAAQLAKEEADKHMIKYWHLDRDNLHKITEYKYRIPICSPNFRHTIAGSRQSILDDGNIQAYDWLIEQARKDKDNPYAFNECLYFAMLMANRYNYRPAYRHVYEIVRTFYSNDEFSQMDYITMYMLSIYANPDQNSPQCFDNLQE